MALLAPYYRHLKCPRCQRSYSCHDNAPFILPCCHTFCWQCVSQINRGERRRCPTCWSHFNHFQINLASLELVLHMALINAQLQSCNECLQPTPISGLRRCLSCEEEVRTRIQFPRVSCVICLQCALNGHQGHDMRREGSVPAQPAAGISRQEGGVGTAQAPTIRQRILDSLTSITRLPKAVYWRVARIFRHRRLREAKGQVRCADNGAFGGASTTPMDDYFYRVVRSYENVEQPREVRTYSNDLLYAQIGG